ncbi:DNA-directed RNA polymerase subunit H [Candidatus Woesearchaeota archaeon]|nr:DNA-directed RNA polymerase subunit H [Candidatus Woesearchaeota archaeon]
MARTKKQRKYDVSAHQLVPKHSKLNQKDTKALFERYNITLKDLPKILANDPALIGLDVKEGDVIAIGRDSPTGGKITYYRGVING